MRPPLMRGALGRARLLAAWAAVLAGAAPGPRAVQVEGPARASSQPPFVDATAETGLDFTHVNGAAGQLLLPEVIGSGGALFDYDNDGDLDLFAVQGSTVPPERPAGAAPRARLYRNDLDAGTGGSPGRDRSPTAARPNEPAPDPAGRRRLRFTDVTGRSGIVADGYGMGAATGDFDNDGWVDLYVTALGSNRLFRNNGNGTFTDVTTASRTGDRRWSTSASFFDYDRDGWLDLFVAHYVNFRRDLKRECYSAASARDYCNPSVYDPVPDALFRNTGNGTFTDMSEKAGLARVPGRGLGVLAADFNDDGWTDVYVANDGDPNHLWLNRSGSGAFVEDALLAGVAVNRMGQPQGSMGIDVGDVDGDGDDDLFVTNLDNEGNTLYRNLGKGLFEDRTVEAGLFKLGFTGFGTRFLDYDNDGWLDLVVVNGAVRHLPAQVRQGDPYPLRQRNQLFRNESGRRFVEVTDRAGSAFAPLHVGRGAAAGDLDNDGDVDLVVFNNSGPARVLLNTAGSARHWIGVRVIDGRRDAFNARVAVLGRRGRVLARRVHTDGSYASAGDPRLLFGLGDDPSPRTVRIRWPDGGVDEFHGLAPGRYWVIERGKPPRAQ